ncbi:hypothetical protein CORC01_11460 [Colletotrichum orchidophilum]|uniref:Uncharacterized protein n=1 Tax=Colletotrichum orchidophilum TaxID=1209926 RepID=A0A1G4AVU6_9PEZI|nr:uncharacterized protein CORC01_11460 [Colletotrichum orchidophilum]OHE93235.1 hypothetical protein CORC01_11460 [Colletotrichum orchidophilum]
MDRDQTRFTHIRLSRLSSCCFPRPYKVQVHPASKASAVPVPTCLPCSSSPSRLHLSHHHQIPFSLLRADRQPQTKQILAHIRQGPFSFSPAHQRYPSLLVPCSIYPPRQNHHNPSATSSILLLEHHIL